MKNIHILLTPYYLLKLILFFKKNNYKIIHCQSLYSLILVNSVKRLLHKDYTIVSTIHIPYARSLFQKILNMFGFKIHANHLIGCCEWALEETIKKNIVKYDDKDFILNWSTNLVNENKVSDGKICFI